MFPVRRWALSLTKQSGVCEVNTLHVENWKMCSEKKALEWSIWVGPVLSEAINVEMGLMTTQMLFPNAPPKADRAFVLLNMQTRLLEWSIHTKNKWSLFSFNKIVIYWSLHVDLRKNNGYSLTWKSSLVWLNLRGQSYAMVHKHVQVTNRKIWKKSRSHSPSFCYPNVEIFHLLGST